MFVRKNLNVASIRGSPVNCSAEIPENEYIKYFAPDFSLKIPGGHIVRSSYVTYSSSLL